MLIDNLFSQLHYECVDLPRPYIDYVKGELERLIKYAKVKNNEVKERISNVDKK